MGGGLENFSALDNLNEAGAPQETAKDVSPAKEARKQKMRAMNDLFKDSLREDPTFETRLRTLSESVAVVNTLGFGEGGNIILDESSTKEERKVVPTSAIVGYRLQNIGKENVSYFTEEYVQNENGVWVGQKVEKVMKPGETIDLNRKYMTILCVRPEISFQLQNGKVMRGPAIVKPGDIDGELEAHYFTFNDKDMKVNSDSIKINVGRRDMKTKKWEVKKEFIPTFGYLNNEKVKSEGRGSRGGGKYNAQDVAANYISRLLQESGNL